MKKLLFTCIALSLITSVFAQLQIEDTILATNERWRDTCFGLIDKSPSQITSGYLLDYSMAGFESANFDGIGTDSIIDGPDDFFSLYSVLTAGAVNSNASLINSRQLFVNAHRYKRNTGNIPLLFLLQPYQKINQNALQNNLFTVTSDSVRLIDVPGRTSSPYDNKEIFICAPIQSRIKTYNSINFILPDEFWLMPGITSVSIDFGDGVGFRTVSKGGSASIYYASTGYKIITVTISTVNGNRTAQTKILYERPFYYFKPDTTWDITVAPVYTSISGYLGMARAGTLSVCGNEGSIFDEINCDINPGAEVKVVNGCDRVFDRPIIVVQGFDLGVGDEVTIDDIINHFEWDQFFSQMQSAGHDFVFVKFKKPTDFIQNNAKVLEDIIYRVNAIKSGSQRGTVIGYSMGGLVARWCLRDMENRNIDHGMGKYFSYDAPHQGANIPLGFQYLFYEIDRDYNFWFSLIDKWFGDGGYGKLLEASKSPAARQMLVTRAQNAGILSTLDPVRAKFALELENMGYPQQVQRYAISFGRGNNTPGTRDAGNGAQFGNFGPGSKIFDGHVIAMLINATAAVYAVPENGVNDYICRYRTLGVKVVRIFGIPVPVPLIKSRNFKYKGYFPYDDAPGGYDGSLAKGIDAFNNANRLGWLVSASHENHRGHNFVPVASALDLRNQGYSAANNWQSNNMFFNIDNNIINPGQISGNTLTNPALSPFQFIQTYTSDCGISACASSNDNLGIRFANWNQNHNGDMSAQATGFLVRKLLNADPWTTCPGLCYATNTISGDVNLVCNTATYELLDVTGASNIHWEALNGYLAITSGQGTPRITVQMISRGAETIRVTLSNSCGQTRTIVRNVKVGAPNASFYSNYTSGSIVNKVLEYCNVLKAPGGPGYYEGVVDVSDPVATNYTWTFVSKYPSNAAVTLTPPGNTTHVLVSIKPQGAYGVWTLRRSNTCGSYTTYHRFNANSDCPPIVAVPYRSFEQEASELNEEDGPEDKYMVLFPNPTRDNVTVAVNTRLAAGSKEGIKEVKIFDVSGRLLKHQRAGAASSISININNLTAGTYFVEITDTADNKVVKNLVIRN